MKDRFSLVQLVFIGEKVALQNKIHHLHGMADIDDYFKAFQFSVSSF